MSKIAIFYMIGQYGDRWAEDFYYEQLTYLQDTGLYERAEFMEVYVKGHIPLPQIANKFNNITFLGDLEEEKPTNHKKYRAYCLIQQRMWAFANVNPEYKILFFHSLGISHSRGLFRETRRTWRRYLEKVLIGNWRECEELLDYYDCVGTDYKEIASYKEETEHYYAPHYQGFFWWANCSYIKKLDPFYFHQNVELQPFLCELWIGSGKPKCYNMYDSGRNGYYDFIYPDYDEILEHTQKHLQELRQNKGQ